MFMARHIPWREFQIVIQRELNTAACQGFDHRNPRLRDMDHVGRRPVFVWEFLSLQWVALIKAAASDFYKCRWKTHALHRFQRLTP
jgi:hypothetical protein